ncbi:hypothetical protein V5O48_018330 [Marasmius crinis-equi]|uniref:CxC2-like cysteine cluster KDZ transposase-associated domain-containing protein n=1 Tax=Marasmius crinis-equi TaxID=585013 RepID=A0ABR3ELH2_9AGAR
MPKVSKSKTKPKARCHEASSSDIKNTFSHQVLSSSKHRVRSSNCNLKLSNTPLASTFVLNNSCDIPDEDIVDSGMAWEPLETPDVAAIGPEKIEGEPGRIVVKPTAKAKRYLDTDVPLQTWSESHCEEYLDWSIITEGRGRLFDGNCARCESPGAEYRCRTCDGLRVVCRGCIIKTHIDEPLHQVELWKSDYFQPIFLKDIGLRFQAGHRPNIRCPCPVISNQDFVVLNWNGIHSITLDFCGCELAISHHLQLMERGWWPSSYKDPRSAATFTLLRNFHITNLQCQTPPTDFIKVLELMGDGEGFLKQPVHAQPGHDATAKILLSESQDREAQWMLMLRQYRHIKTAKRSGRGHDPAGIAATAHGSTTVPCRACPHPSKNLSSSWQQAPTSDQFLYTLFLAEDANFKQKARARKNDSRDPTLSPGWGCFVPNGVYMTEIGKRTNQDEISHCAGFAAIASANSKTTRGLRATGIGSVTCARHDTFRPNGMGDLQVGERYSNMDFLALYNLIACGVMRIVFSYDIACQWMRNFYTRMAEFPSYMQLPSNLTVLFKVPKFHLPAHGLACLAKFAFNYTEGVGKTDGEGVERTWSWLNGCARSLSMMTVGARWETMDDFTNFWNWKKTTNLVNLLLNKMVAAISEGVINTRVFSGFTDALKPDYEAEVSKWEEMVSRWEQGLSEECPYDVTEPDITMSKVKKDMAEEDHRREMAGKSSPLQTASSVIIEGLDIEDSQQHILAMLKIKNLTEFKETSIQKKRTALLQRIRKFYGSLRHHMPAVQRLIDKDSPLSEATRPEELKLFLPSSLDPSILRPLPPSPANSNPGTTRIVCPSELIDMEDRLRFAQAHESLSRLRAQLRARTVAYKETSKESASQTMYLRLHTLQDQIEAKVKALSETYRRAQAALLVLRGEGPWCTVLRELQPEDVRGISERILRAAEKRRLDKDRERAGISTEELNSLVGKVNVPTVAVNPTLTRGQDKDQLSWIWYTHRIVVESSDGMDSISGEEGVDFQELQESLCSEWCKARARARRSHEEIRLVAEEMRRSIAFCQYQSAWRQAQCNQRHNIPGYLQEGLTAYAKEHANVEVVRANTWTKSWAAIREHAKSVLLDLSDPYNVGTLRSLQELEVEIDLREETKDCIVDEEDDT